MAGIDEVLQQCVLIANKNHLVQSAKVQEDYVNDKPIVRVRLKLYSPVGHEADFTQLLRTLRTKIPKEYKLDVAVRLSL